MNFLCNLFWILLFVTQNFLNNFLCIALFAVYFVLSSHLYLFNLSLIQRKSFTKANLFFLYPNNEFSHKLFKCALYFHKFESLQTELRVVLPAKQGFAYSGQRRLIFQLQFDFFFTIFDSLFNFPSYSYCLQISSRIFNPCHANYVNLRSKKSHFTSTLLTGHSTFI